MRFIRKNESEGIRKLKHHHANPPHTDTEASERWEKLKNKEIVRKVLLKEQYQLCCYSELRADKMGLGYHIEHVINKSQEPTRTFDYMNLAASALDSNNGINEVKKQGHEIFGGHAQGKQKGVDPNLFVSCLQDDCQRFFAYLSNGKVEPALNLNELDKKRAAYTIDLLELNSNYLVNLRQSWSKELYQVLQEYEDDIESLAKLAAIELVPDENTMLSSFFSLTRQFYVDLAERILQEKAPDLL